MGATGEMNYEEFKDYVKNNILKYLPPEYEDANVKVTQIQKNNGVQLDGMIIETENTNVFPTIYLNDFYREHVDGAEMVSIMEKIKDVQLEHALDTRMDVSKITDINNVRDRIIPRIINAERNEELLNDRPHMLMDDLAVTYHIQLDGCQDALATVAITDAVASQLGVTQPELHDIALTNLPEVSKPQFINMAEMLASTVIPGFDSMSPTEKQDAINEVMPPDPAVPMYIITNANKTHGASAVLDENLMREVEEKLGDVYILPSSTHELILLPIDENTPTLSELEGLVQEVNQTQVAEQDFLSDHVYAYDSNTKELYRADMKEAHLEKTAAKEDKSKDVKEQRKEPDKKESPKKEEQKKPSLRAKLEDKKAEVAKEKALMANKEITKEKSVAI